jgi:threonine/homoserine/homoserine lactone efflux protein
MLEWPTISLFVVAASVLVIMPGPNTVFIITRSMQQGFAAGIVSCLGVLVGTLLHVTLAAIGLSALVISSILAFNIVKFTGAAYLIYLGIKTLFAKDSTETGDVSLKEDRLKTIFHQGIAVNVLNPKTALFIAAFLPQFIVVGQEISITSQIFILGTILVVIGGLSDMAYALLAARVGGWLQRNTLPQLGQRYFAGVVYVGLGAATALTGMNHK